MRNVSDAIAFIIDGKTGRLEGFFIAEHHLYRQ